MVRLLTRRLDRLNIQMGFGPETAQQRQTREAADAILRCRAARLGLPPPPPCAIQRYDPRKPRRSAAEAIKEARARRRERLVL
jgi:hypothetical protein